LEFGLKSTRLVLQLLHSLKRVGELSVPIIGEHPNLLHRRAALLQKISRALLSHLQVSIQTRGEIPNRGLLVSNHVSFVDIMLLSALNPLVFVSKSEVARWPIIGPIAVKSGTLFIERQKRSDVSRINEALSHAFNADVLACIFPEGTSSDGTGVLPFQPSLLQPAISAQLPVCPAHIRYETEGGIRADDIAYFGDRNLMDCMRALIRRKKTIARVSFGSPVAADTDRKSLAFLLNHEVCRLGQFKHRDSHA
jgi:1-acyl-sn-glycerol-3-phosphate acyltransferase